MHDVKTVVKAEKENDLHGLGLAFFAREVLYTIVGRYLNET